MVIWAESPGALVTWQPDALLVPMVPWYLGSLWYSGTLVPWPPGSLVVPWDPGIQDVGPARVPEGTSVLGKQGTHARDKGSKQQPGTLKT